MPAMYFEVRWPDQHTMRCYSPSSVIQQHLRPHTTYALPDFLAHVRAALHEASERVHAKYGFACSQAMDQLALIEAVATGFTADAHAEVTVLHVGLPAQD